MTALADKLAQLRKKDKDLRVGSLADFDMRPIPLTTGNIALDNALGTGGFPRGKVVECFGPSQSGKTTSALQAAALHQKRVKAGEDTGAILFLDYERSLDQPYCEALGLDPYDEETFIYTQPDSLEAGANLFRSLMQEDLLALAIFDSLAAMVSEKELAAETGAVTVGDRAKALHQFMRQIKGPIWQHKTCVIFLNHVMDVIETTPMGRKLAASGIQRKTTPGGKALIFYSDQRLEFGEGKKQKTEVHNVVLNEDETLETSKDVTAKVVKNKLAVPQKVARMRVRYGKGFSQPYSVYQVLVAYKVIKVSGSWITVPASITNAEDLKVQGEETVIRLLEKDWEIFITALNKAEELVANYKPGQDTDDIEIDPNIDPETGEVRDDYDPDLGGSTFDALDRRKG